MHSLFDELTDGEIIEALKENSAFDEYSTSFAGFEGALRVITFAVYEVSFHW